MYLIAKVIPRVGWRLQSTTATATPAPEPSERGQGTTPQSHGS